MEEKEEEEEEEEEEEQVKPSAPAISRASTTTFDDQGEPDFAGWLNAQAQSKNKIKGQLPKGLAKTKGNSTTTTARPGAGSLAAKVPQSRSVSASKVITQSKPTPVEKKEDDDDDWGEAWG